MSKPDPKQIIMSPATGELPTVYNIVHEGTSAGNVPYFVGRGERGPREGKIEAYAHPHKGSPTGAQQRNFRRVAEDVQDLLTNERYDEAITRLNHDG